jgi:hypothetical protein
MSKKFRPLLTRNLVFSGLIAGASVLALTYPQSYARAVQFSSSDTV